MTTSVEKIVGMTSVYNLNQLFETVIEQIEMSVNFSDARRVPYNPNRWPQLSMT